jgi:non-ribosomal peptide synthetase component F
MFVGIGIASQIGAKLTQRLVGDYLGICIYCALRLILCIWDFRQVLYYISITVPHFYLGLLFLTQGHMSPQPFRPPKPEDAATICYTSGTTGTPKVIHSSDYLLLHIWDSCTLIFQICKAGGLSFFSGSCSFSCEFHCKCSRIRL